MYQLGIGGINKIIKKNSHANKTHFHKKGFALGLILKVKGLGRRKWHIPHDTYPTQSNGQLQNGQYGVIIELDNQKHLMIIKTVEAVYKF